jgi:hypothetical protein
MEEAPHAAHSKTNDIDCMRPIVTLLLLLTVPLNSFLHLLGIARREFSLYVIRDVMEHSIRILALGLFGVAKSCVVTRQRIVRFPSGYSHSAFRSRNDSKVPSHGERLFDGKAHGHV